MKRSNAHLEEVGETYFEHMGQASRFGSRMIISGLACLVHGLVPSLCVKTGSNTINELHHRMVTHRIKDKPPVGLAQGEH